MKQTVLVVAAHPDDELLGVGGSLVWHVARGDAVHLLILSDGETSRGAVANVSARALMAREVSAQLMAASIRIESFADNQFDTHSLLSITKSIEQHIAEISPDIIYTHHPHDLNIDHQRTSAAVMTAARPLPDTSVRAIIAFETVSATEWGMSIAPQRFAPTFYRDISAQIEEKLRLLHCYDQEMRAYPHPRSYDGVRILAQKRGMEVGVSYAEAFCILRWLEQ